MEIITNYLPNPVLSVLLLAVAKEVDAKFFASKGWHRLEKVPGSIQKSIYEKWKRFLEKVKISLWETLSIVLYWGIDVLKRIPVIGWLLVWIYAICNFIKTSIQKTMKAITYLRDIVFSTESGNRNNGHNQGGGGSRGQQTRYRYYYNNGVNRNTRPRGTRNDNNPRNAPWNWKNVVTDHPYRCMAAVIVFAWIVIQIFEDNGDTYSASASFEAL